MAGQQMRRALEPHDTPGPAPSITDTQFREQFTEEVRGSINMAVQNAIIYERQFWIARGMDEQEAGVLARALYAPARLGQRLIGFLAPGPYLW